jgi:acetyltransferase-like isoleucine patch superfamily enzyme
MIMTYGGTIHIEGHSSINPYCVVYGHGGLRIGSRVRIAAQTVIIPANHGFEDLEIPICDQPITRKGIRVEDNVWIGAGCRILDGVVISSGCVIAAGAVVTKSTVPNGVYAGVPARLLKLRV